MTKAENCSDILDHILSCIAEHDSISEIKKLIENLKCYTGQFNIPENAIENMLGSTHYMSIASKKCSASINKYGPEDQSLMFTTPGEEPFLQMHAIHLIRLKHFIWINKLYIIDIAIGLSDKLDDMIDAKTLN